ncbi:hypothetical protein E2C01_012036 [Portunus trituberculatus]|uniref:Uncharacterized protein n=1 Tax=Portunus trituberculatus TaxID=210409 RepID=A0A5B7DCW3_PORTR|nr:hypothetical protein [Portunus trituberculatus]
MENLATAGLSQKRLSSPVPFLPYPSFLPTDPHWESYHHSPQRILNPPLAGWDISPYEQCAEGRKVGCWVVGIPLTSTYHRIALLDRLGGRSNGVIAHLRPPVIQKIGRRVLTHNQPSLPGPPADELVTGFIFLSDTTHREAEQRSPVRKATSSWSEMTGVPAGSQPATSIPAWEQLLGATFVLVRVVSRSLSNANIALFVSRPGPHKKLGGQRAYEIYYLMRGKVRKADSEQLARLLWEAASREQRRGVGAISEAYTRSRPRLDGMLFITTN